MTPRVTLLERWQAGGRSQDVPHGTELDDEDAFGDAVVRGTLRATDARQFVRPTRLRRAVVTTVGADDYLLPTPVWIDRSLRPIRRCVREAGSPAGLRSDPNRNAERR